MKGSRSTPGRYFQVAEPGTAWGGTNIDRSAVDSAAISIAKIAWPGLRLLMVSTTGEHYAYFELDEALQAGRKGIARRAARIGRPNQGELRTGAVYGPLYGRRRRLACARG